MMNGKLHMRTSYHEYEAGTLEASELGQMGSCANWDTKERWKGTGSIQNTLHLAQQEEGFTSGTP
jgi:hypothetical protein